MPPQTEGPPQVDMQVCPQVWVWPHTWGPPIVTLGPGAAAAKLDLPWQPQVWPPPQCVTGPMRPQPPPPQPPQVWTPPHCVTGPMLTPPPPPQPPQVWTPP